MFRGRTRPYVVRGEEPFTPANIQHPKNENKGKNVHISIFIISEIFVYVYYRTYFRNGFVMESRSSSATSHYAITQLRITQAQTG